MMRTSVIFAYEKGVNRPAVNTNPIGPHTEP